MKQLFFLVSLFFGFAFLSHSQVDKVQWTSNAKQIDDKTFEITLTATVADGWYIYSQYMEEGGPIPTEILFEGTNFKPKGETKEIGNITKEAFDEVFEIDVKKFGKEAKFTQIIVTNGNTPTIHAMITYMSCNDERCNPPRQIKVPVEL